MAMNSGYELKGCYDLEYVKHPSVSGLSEETARRLKHGYYASVSFVDACFGKLMQGLAELKRYMGYSRVTARYRYIEWYTWDHRTGVAGGLAAVELCDQQEDPNENTNIADLVENQALVEGHSDQSKRSRPNGGLPADAR